MKRGIVLLAIEKPNYMQFAFNMALSIKHHSNIPIQLIHSEGLLDKLHPYMREVFDSFTVMNREDMFVQSEGRKGRTEERFEPGRAKLNLYKYLEFDESIYLDVDGVAVRDISSLFDYCKKDVQVQRYSGAQENSVDETADKWACIWMPLEEVRKNYSLPEKYTLPEINSSFLFIRKGELSEKFYSQSLANFREGYKGGWGNRFPDELAYNIAFAQVGIDPTFESNIVPVYFRTYTDNKRPVDKLEDIKKDHWIIGAYGSFKLNHSSIVSSSGYYDKLIGHYMKQRFGRNIVYKIHRLMETKHVLNKKG